MRSSQDTTQTLPYYRSCCLRYCLWQVFERLAEGELSGKPDAWTHSALCLAFRRGQQFSAVFEVYKMMREQGMPIYKDVFYAALEACERLCLWREGQDVLRHVQVKFRIIVPVFLKLQSSKN